MDRERPVFVRFLIGILATWRIVELVKDEDGPFKSLERLRRYAHQNREKHPIIQELSEALKCRWCLSVWIGWIVALILARQNFFIRGLAYSAASLILTFVMQEAELYHPTE